MTDIQVGSVRRLVITDGDLELTPIAFTAEVDDTSVGTVAERGDQLEWDLTGVHEGDVKVTATGIGAFAGKSGSATFHVDPAEPLGVALGDPLPTS